MDYKSLPKERNCNQQYFQRISDYKKLLNIDSRYVAESRVEELYSKEICRSSFSLSPMNRMDKNKDNHGREQLQTKNYGNKELSLKSL